jgi:alkylation response protein AidB-like acyl-CoA dehydrogenase
MRFVGQQAVQLHGGIGVTNEYIVSHYFKKLTQLEMTFGDSLTHETATTKSLNAAVTPEAVEARRAQVQARGRTQA